jgi:hypothetical protein
MEPLGNVMDGVPGRKDQIPVVNLISTCFRRAHSRTKCFGIGRNDAGFVLARKTCFGQLEWMWNDSRTTIYSREPMQ